jgi:hypothetical protein
MLIKNPGSVSFWFDPKNNEFSFKEGNIIHWVSFKVENEIGTIFSDGETLVGLFNQNSNRELQIFKTKISPDVEQRHMIALSWKSDEIILLVDGKLVQSINPNDLEFKF